MSAGGIIVLGSVNMDLVVQGPRLPRPGETVLGGRYYQSLGGKGANQAVAAARAAKGDVTLLAAVGDDAYGRQALAAFQSEPRLVAAHVRMIDGEPTGIALVMVDEQGENAICVAPGANARLPADAVDALADSVFRSAAVFLACLEAPHEAVERGLRRAKQAGLLTILNPAPADPRMCRRDLLELVDVLTPNENEAALLAAAAGERGTALDPAACAGRLRDLGCQAVIVTRGARGCQVVADSIVAVPGCPVSAVDATAAGDAFNGALAAALAAGHPLVEAARFANQAAAISVGRRGAQASLPRRDEIEAALRREGP